MAPVWTVWTVLFLRGSSILGFSRVRVPRPPGSVPPGSCKKDGNYYLGLALLAGARCTMAPFLK